MNRFLKTKLFETVHPLTYLLALQSIAWGIIIIIHLLFPVVDLLDVGSLFYPNFVSYVWSSAMVVVGIIATIFLLRDYYERGKKRIWYAAVANLSLWMFAATVWVNIGAEAMLFISIYNIIGFFYLALASRFSRLSHRI